MKLFEITTKPQLLYHSTSDKYAIQILREGKMYPSEDAIDDTYISFISTTTNPQLLFFNGFPDTGNIQFVFDSNVLSRLGYQLQNVSRWNEVRIILPENVDTLPINNKTVHHIQIDGQRRYFKGWAKDIDFDTSWGEESYSRLQKNELNPKGEFVGSQNPFGIIKMAAIKRHISVIDNRTPVK